MDNFVNLHVGTEFSLSDKICKIDELIERAKSYNMTALVKSDFGKNGLYGNILFYKKCLANNIKPIIGVKCCLKIDNEKVFIALYAKDIKGYENLSIIFSERFDNKLENVLKHHNSLICVVKPHKKQQENGIITKLKEVYKDDLYIGLTGSGDYYDYVKTLSNEFNIPLVISNAVCYVDKNDCKAYRVNKKLHEIRHNYMHDSDNAWEEEAYFKSFEETLQDYPNDLDAILRTNEIADKCNIVFEENKKDVCKYSEVDLRQDILFGLSNRGIEVNEDISKRIELEWQHFKKNNQLGYLSFINVLVKYTRKNNILLGSGRGCACSSLILYALNIVDINPIKYGLIFERIPKKLDIDIDISENDSEKIVNYFKKTYGNENVLRVCSFGVNYAQSLLIEVSKIFNCEKEYIEKINSIYLNAKENNPLVRNISDLIPIHGYSLYNDKTILDLFNNDEMFREIVYVVDKLESLPYSSSCHACKLVINNGVTLPTEEIDNNYVVMYSTEEVEYLGLFDFDILRLNTLERIKKSLKIIKERYNKKIVFDSNKCGDSKTFDLINSLDIEKVFDIDSENIKQLIKKYPVKSINDLSMIIALNRPYTEEIKECEDEDVRKIVEPYLEETKGLLIYQEQLMNILHNEFGFSYEDADGARRQIAKRKYENISDYKKMFYDKSIPKYGVKMTEKIWDYLWKQGKYTFLKAHSISYAYMSYQTAFIKAKYRKEFDEVFSKNDEGNSII